MGEFKYANELLSSFQEVFRKPILLLPFIYIFILSVVFLFITPNSYVIDETTINYDALVLIVGLGIIQVILSIAFRGMGLIGLRDYTNEQEVTAKNQFFGGLKIFWKLLLLVILQIIVFAIPIVIGLAIFFAIYAISITAGIVVGLILLLLFIAYVIFAGYYLMFSSVIIAYEGKTAGNALVDSYNYAKQNVGHTVRTLVTIFVATLILLVILMIVSIPFLFSTELEILQQIITGFIGIFVSAGFTLFLFKAFNAGGRDVKVSQSAADAIELNNLQEKKQAEKKPLMKKKAVTKKKAAKK